MGTSRADSTNRGPIRGVEDRFTPELEKENAVVARRGDPSMQKRSDLLTTSAQFHLFTFRMRLSAFVSHLKPRSLYTAKVEDPRKARVPLLLPVPGPGAESPPR